MTSTGARWLASFLLVVASFAHAQTDTAFDQRFAKLIEAARAEGELTWYQSSLEKAGRDYAALFQKRFRVKLNQIYIVGSPNLERFRSESRAGRHIADVFTTSDGTLMLPAMTEGLLADYKTASTDRYPKNWLMNVNGVTTYPTGRVQMVLAYNTQTVNAQEARVLREWKGLVDPAMKGRLSMADATRIGAVYPMYLYWLRANPNEYGRAFLEKFAAQKPVIYGSMTEQASRMAAGEVDVGLLNDLVGIQQYDRGAPIAFYYPSPTPVTLHFTGISKNAPHPNAARLFLEYFTSDEGVAEWGRVWGAGTGRPDVDAKSTAKYTKEPWYKAATEFYEIRDWAEAERQHGPVIKEWSAIFRK